MPLPRPHLSRAGNGTRTRDPNLGKVVLYQLSYSRASINIAAARAPDKHPVSPPGTQPDGGPRSTTPHHGFTPSACTAYQTV